MSSDAGKLLRTPALIKLKTKAQALFFNQPVDTTLEGKWDGPNHLHPCILPKVKYSQTSRTALIRCRLGRDVYSQG